MSSSSTSPQISGQANKTASLDPLSQYNLLLENLNDILKNLDYLAKKVGIVSINQVPCDVAKFITNQICSGSYSIDVNNLTSMVQSRVGKLGQELSSRIQQGGKRGGKPYDTIMNPETGRFVSIHSKKGKEIIKKYMSFL